MNLKLKEVSYFEKPRERLIEVGVENLNNNELLCLLIRCGTHEKDVIDLSNDVLNLINSFDDLKELTLTELMEIKGIGLSKATIILSAIELGRRLNQKMIDRTKITTPLAIYNQFKAMMAKFTQEHLYTLYLDTKGKLIDYRLIGIGTTNSVTVDIKEIFKWAYKFKASALILVHNHPSGDATPSVEDLKMTEEIAKQARLLKFILLDHIIIGDDYHSMKESNHLF